MPRKLPTEIENYLAQYAFSKHIEIFWVRARVLEVNEKISVREDIAGYGRREEKLITIVDAYDVDALHISNINRDTALSICLDNIPRHYGIEPTDVISVFGHRPVGSTTVRPRYMINHNTGKSNAAYYDVKIEGERSDQFWSPVILHTWLKTSYKRKAKLSERISSSCSVFFILIILGIFPLVGVKMMIDSIPADYQITAAIITAIVISIAFLAVGWFSSKDETIGVDLTEHYKHIAVAIHRPGHFRSPGFEDCYRD